MNDNRSPDGRLSVPPAACRKPSWERGTGIPRSTVSCAWSQHTAREVHVENLILTDLLVWRDGQIPRPEIARNPVLAYGHRPRSGFRDRASGKARPLRGKGHGTARPGSADARSLVAFRSIPICLSAVCSFTMAKASNGCPTVFSPFPGTASSEGRPYNARTWGRLTSSSSSSIWPG